MINNEIKEKTIIKKKERVKLKKPKTYRVLLHNNNSTPYQSVVDVLMTVFNKNEKTAWDVMWECHEQGRSQCFEGSKSICEAKLEEANNYCKMKQQEDYSKLYQLLQFSVEEID